VKKLKSKSKLSNVTTGMVEGKDYINIAKLSKLDIGKELSPGYGFQFTTMFGKAGTVRSAMDYISIKDYPKDLLSKKKLLSKDIKRITGKRINVTNYWAMVMYIVAERIKQDTALIETIKDMPDDIVITSLLTNEVKTFGLVGSVYVVNTKMSMYVAVIKTFVYMIKNDEFTDDSILKEINDARVDDSHEFYDGLAINIIIDKKETTNE